jgi:membrane protein YdbS with pleckstrin-like domain
MAPLESIRDVQSSGEWWANFLGYARLEVQTPGTLGNIVFDQAAKSKPVVDVIRAQRALRARQARITGKKQIHTMLENRLGVALDLPPRVVQSRQEAAQEAGAQAKSAQNARRTHRRPVTLAPDGQPTRIVWRQHWIILLRNILFQILIVAGLLAGAVFFLYTTRFEAWRNSLSLTMMLSALLIALWTVWILEDWRLDMYILEMEQVIDIERKPFGFDRNQRTALLTDIVDIRFEQPSPLHILFNYGSVFLQTAATDGQFTFLNLSDPQRAAEIIRRRRDQMQVRNEQNSAMQRAEEFPDWLEIYTRLQPGRLE